MGGLYIVYLYLYITYIQTYLLYLCMNAPTYLQDISTYIHTYILTKHAQAESADDAKAAFITLEIEWSPGAGRRGGNGRPHNAKGLGEGTAMMEPGGKRIGSH